MASGFAFSSGGEVDASATMPILPYLPELIFGLICFLVIYLIAAKKFVPAMEKTYAERAAAIEGGMNRAEEAQREANAAKAQYQAQLAESRADAARVREEAREQGAAIVAEMRDQASAEAARIIDGAHRQIEADRQAAFNALKGDVGRMSTDLASRIVGESLDSEVRQRGIVERFLAELESGSVRPEKLTDGTDR